MSKATGEHICSALEERAPSGSSRTALGEGVVGKAHGFKGIWLGCVSRPKERGRGRGRAMERGCGESGGQRSSSEEKEGFSEHRGWAHRGTPGEVQACAIWGTSVRIKGIEPGL